MVFKVDGDNEELKVDSCASESMRSSIVGSVVNP
jgi:hypothetical protein